MNNNLLLKKIIIALVGIIIISTAGLTWLYLHYQQERTTTDIAVRLDGVASAQLVDTVSGEVLRQVEDNDEVNLKIGADNYIIRYTGAEGFADGETTPINTFESELNINANFSRQRLDTLLVNEKNAIDQAINNTYSNLNQLFTIGDGELFMRGDWYGVILNYRGNALTDRDDVVLVLHKKDDVWTVATDPPLPSVTIRDGAKLQIPEDVRQPLNDKVLLGNNNQ